MMNDYISLLDVNPSVGSLKDASPVFQETLEYAYKKDIEIEIPRGTFRIRTPVKLPYKVSIRGANHFHTVMDQMRSCECRLILEADVMFAGGAPEEPAVCKLNLRDVAFDNPALGGDVFSYFNFENSYIRRCIFRGFNNVIVGNLRKLTKVKDNIFLATLNSAISNKLITGAEAWSADSWIRDNYFNSAPSRISVNSIPLYFGRSTSTWIEGNHIDFSYEGIHLYGDKGFHVRDNHFSYCYRGIYAEGSTRDSTVSDNIFTNITKNVVGKFAKPLDEMRNNNWTCISLKNSRHLSVCDNLASKSDEILSKTGCSNIIERDNYNDPE